MKKKLYKIFAWIEDILYFAGMACMTAGAGKIYPPAGYLTCGAMLVAYALLISRR